jgi:LPXTG-motif cell wall-anchored protein
MLEFRRRVLALVLAFALVPASAFAQGAGDDQYQDPFGDEQEQEEATPAPTPQTPAATPAPATAQPAQSAPTAAPPSSTPQRSSNTLPYTGIDGWPVAIAGALLLGAGLMLRVRLRADERA